MYRFNKLRFVFITASGTAQSGVIAFIPDYDAADPAPETFQEASSFEDFIEDVAWKRITCDLKTRAMFPMGPRKFIRNAALAANLDIKTYDAGVMFVASNNANGALGNIWAEYDVTLYVPTLLLPVIPQPLFQHFAGISPTTALPFNSIDTNHGSIIATLAAKVVTFTIAGSYILTYNAAASTSVTITDSVIAGASLVFNTAPYSGDGFT
jgi:hypothetical protein